MLCRSLPLLLLAACAVAVAPNAGDPRAAQVLSSLAPAFDVEGRAPVRWTLDEEMAKHQVPGVSIAVVDGDRIWSSARGVLQAGEPEPVTEHSVFQAASISKVIAATMTLRLVGDESLHRATDED